MLNYIKFLTYSLRGNVNPFDLENSKNFVPNKNNLKKVVKADYNTLHLLATKYKQQGDINLAITCLQQAGYFEESNQELKRLYDNADFFVLKNLIGIHQNIKLNKKWLKSLYLSYLFDKARLIYKREKQLDKSTKFAKIAKYYDQFANGYSNKLQLIRDSKDEEKITQQKQQQQQLKMT